MMLQVSTKFDSYRTSNEIIQVLTEFVNLKKGTILSQSENHLSVKFGNRLMLRLFGGCLLSIFFKNHLPFEMDVTIESVASINHISIHCGDNLGRFIIRDPLGQSVYKEYYVEFLNEVKDNLEKAS